MTDADLLGDWAPMPAIMRDADGLTEQERRLVNEYAASPNVRRAAKHAGYETGEALKLLNLPRIRIPLARREKEMRERIMITVANVTREYAAVAFQDPRNYFTADGDPIPIHELTDFAAAALAGVDINITEVNGAITQRSYKYKFTSKLDALGVLGKMLNLTTEKLELTGAGGAPLIPEATENERARRVAFMLARALQAKQSGNLVDIEA